MYDCKSCCESLPLSEYYIDSRTGGRKWATCKTCKKSQLNSKYRGDESFRETSIARAKEYYENNKGKVSERRKNSAVVKKYEAEYRQRPSVKEKQRECGLQICMIEN